MRSRAGCQGGSDFIELPAKRVPVADVGEPDVQNITRFSMTAKPQARHLGLKESAIDYANICSLHIFRLEDPNTSEGYPR